MYNLSLFGIFTEGHLLNITQSFCERLSSILNDKLANYLITFIDEFDQSDAARGGDEVACALVEKIELLKKYTLPRAKVLTLHIYLQSKEFKDMNMFEFVRTLSLERINPLSMTYSDIVLVKDCLEEVLSLMPVMVDRIEARQKKDYEAFLSEVSDVASATGIMEMMFAEKGLTGIIDFGENCFEMCKSNSELFYSHREPARFTGLSSIIKKAQDYSTILYGLRYIEICDKDQISMANRALI